jgi:manganese oxidase
MHQLFIFVILSSWAAIVRSGSRSCYKQSSYKYKSATRHYCIAATEVEWNYAPQSTADQMDLTELYEPEAQTALTSSDYNIGPLYRKYAYRQYPYNSNKKICDWTMPLEHPVINGLMGPTLRGVVGDTLKVHFYNDCSEQSHSIVPRGLFYQQVTCNTSVLHTNAPYIPYHTIPYPYAVK